VPAKYAMTTSVLIVAELYVPSNINLRSRHGTTLGLLVIAKKERKVGRKLRKKGRKETRKE